MTAPPRVSGYFEASLSRLAGSPAQWTLLLAVALAVAVLAMLAAGATNRAYYHRNPIFGDTASYFLLQQQIWLESEAVGKLAAIWRDFFDNPRNPGLTLSYLFLPRDELLKLNGHLYYTGVSFFALVATFAICVWRRTGSLAWACAVSVLPLVAEGFFNPMYQVPSKLPDPPAAFFAGAALFCLLNSSGARVPIWLALFGVFAAFSALSRFIAAGYVLVICGPILAAYLLNLWRKEPEWKRLIQRALLCVATPIALLAGTFLWQHGPGNFIFYSHAGYSLNQTLGAALYLTLGKFLALFLGPVGIVTLGILVIVAVAERGLRLLGMWDSLWAAFSQIVFIVFVLRVGDDSPQLVYAYPGILLLAAAPFRIGPKRRGVFHRGAALALGLVLTSTVWLHWYRETQGERSFFPNAVEARIKSLNGDLARAVIEHPLPNPRIPTIEAAFSYYGRYVSATAIVDYGRVVSYQQRFFEIRESQWTLNNRHLERSELFKRAAEKIDANIDFLAVLDRPSAAQARPMLYDDYTVAMAEDLNAHIAAHPQRWIAMKRFESPWGPVTLYRNGKRT